MEGSVTLHADMHEIQTIFGEFDKNVRKIEDALSVTTLYRDGILTISGEKKAAEQAGTVFHDLLHLVKNGSPISEQAVDYAIRLAGNGENERVSDLSGDGDLICHTLSGRPVRPKTHGQKNYVKAIDENMIVFGTGPAGTGKTYLAMAKAITAFKRGDVERIILTRPAIEAGEKLGYLPGDLQSKIDPYLRPLYDALYEIMGAESFQRNVEKGLIEVAPLAYMRGRTLDRAFIVLDEAQNTTESQMKMFLTRIGFGSKAVVTGDLTQKDLGGSVQSGLETALKVVKGIEGIALVELTSVDVVRHPLVQKIVEAYEVYDRKKARSAAPVRNEKRGRDGRRDNRK